MVLADAVPLVSRPMMPEIRELLLMELATAEVAADVAVFAVEEAEEAAP